MKSVARGLVLGRGSRQVRIEKRTGGRQEPCAANKKANRLNIKGKRLKYAHGHFSVFL